MSNTLPAQNGLLARASMEYARHQPEQTLLYQVIDGEPRILSKALEVVTRAISTYLVKKTGFTHTTAKTGSVTLIQRFGSALNLNIHFHMLFLDEEVDEIKGQTLAKGGGFSLHAGVSAKAHQRDKVERLCRYIARPAVSTHRLERLPDGTLSYELKTPYKNGTTHMDGLPNEWHLFHLGSRAVGGAGLVMVEATAVSKEGRISSADNGIWTDEHVAYYRKISDFIKAQGAVSGIQIAHAGRKASVATPSEGGQVLAPEKGGWQTIAPSDIPFIEGNHPPLAMQELALQQTLLDFELATQRAFRAGFQVLELHMAHGYLLHQFLSPLSNHRQDKYGGSLENRMRFPLLELPHQYARAY